MQKSNRKTAPSALTISSLLSETAKQLRQPATYSKKNLATQWQRIKRVMNLMAAIQTGIGYAWQISHTPNPDNQQIIQLIQKFCKKSLKALGIEVIALEPIPTHHALWASNHISWLDIPVVGSIVPTFFLSKAEIANWPVIGWMATTAHTLFIQRGSGDTSKISEQMSEFLSQGSPVVFFPEATTTDGTAIKRIYGNLLQSAMDSQVLIQPIVICYVNQDGELDQNIPYYGDISLIDSVKRVLDNPPAKAYVLPLAAIDPAGKTRNEITAILQQRMVDGLARLHGQVLHAKKP
ncbi:1-acyl-sn-glycerol-3-phosphate acyltransferase [Enhydrobacter sp. 8BJ]|nr:lysophospholipid acyltransferase family protein [Enhydrobacter sp. 8BJ]VXB05300.1 1-acyl-sn-glycerol-3-phosphate acyltransferase [Enhydrobacter sp. 8BJ]